MLSALHELLAIRLVRYFQTVWKMLSDPFPPFGLGCFKGRILQVRKPSTAVLEVDHLFELSCLLKPYFLPFRALAPLTFLYLCTLISINWPSLLWLLIFASSVSLMVCAAIFTAMVLGERGLTWNGFTKTRPFHSHLLPHPRRQRVPTIFDCGKTCPLMGIHFCLENRCNPPAANSQPELFWSCGAWCTLLCLLAGSCFWLAGSMHSISGGNLRAIRTLWEHFTDHLSLTSIPDWSKSVPMTPTDALRQCCAFSISSSVTIFLCKLLRASCMSMQTLGCRFSKWPWSEQLWQSLSPEVLLC